jgi:hypothetical protein
VSLIALAKGTQIVAAVSSIALARRRAEHVPAAVALVVLTAATLVRRPLRLALGPPQELPYEGAARMLVYLDGAAELATYATIAGLALAVAVSEPYRRRVAALVVAAWALASVELGMMYPSPLVRSAGLQRVYFAADLIGLFVSAIALVLWVERSVALKRSPRSLDLVAWGLVSLDGAVLLAPFSPWRGDVFGSDFSGPAVIITMFFAAFAVAQVTSWVRSGSGSRSD